MVKQGRKGEVGSPWMIDADERRIGDHVEALLAPVIGMSSPAHVGEETSGMAKPTLAFGFLDLGAGEEAICPGAKLFPVKGRARL